VSGLPTISPGFPGIGTTPGIGLAFMFLYMKKI
jgi:hypothetical protein